ncbi:tRNA lysidine(34) synthetase TilS [Megalodesulfovibrio gigas]|uniref:tRNA lysidine(34) synthetase TilS n=1 Tax=Megalodesulfovibrio gigas TaxID=879 RepID=UPI000402A9AB|nr:tRNA lysidine(34) synthetase TilS [Megalodesulfovibrio gigas]
MAETLGIVLSGTRLVVACSGGPDSMALLAMLHALRVRGGFSLVAAHLDHGLRPDAAADQAAVAQLCHHLDIQCISQRMDVAALAAQQRMGLEEAGRLARQEFLARVRSDHGAQWIVTGHQLNDLAEDQLMRQLRGAGWPALGGMAGCDAASGVLRPLLLQPKAALLELASTLRLPFRNDPMNEDPRFFRNRIRNTILPLFLAENPSYLSQVAGLWLLAQLDARHFSMAMDAAPALPDHGGTSLLLPATALRSVDAAIRLRCCKRALERLALGAPQLETLLALEAAFTAGRIGAVFHFPGRVTARVLSQGLHFSAPDAAATSP